MVKLTRRKEKIMIRHIFIATILEGASDELVEKKMAEMRAMKNSVPAIKNIWVGRSLGFAGPTDRVSMIVDVDDKAGFEALLASEAHTEVAGKAREAFRTDNMIPSQIEI